MLQERLIERGWSAWYSERLKVRHEISAERLTQEWILRRAYWDGRSDQRIGALNARKPNVLEVGKVLAKTLALSLLYLGDTPQNEFRIRFWYNIGWLREGIAPGVRGTNGTWLVRNGNTTASGAIKIKRAWPRWPQLNRNRKGVMIDGGSLKLDALRSARTLAKTLVLVLPDFAETPANEFLIPTDIG
jgi:hypothetical protein